MLLAGDIGGTKTDLAIFSSEKGPRSPLAQARFRSADYHGLEAIIQEFLTKTKIAVDRACFAVAGPVRGGRARLTNLPWLVEQIALKKAMGIEAVYLLNDLEAMASAVPHLLPNELYALNPGEPLAGGAIAVVAPGTGLGEAFLTWDGTDYCAHPSEGGHADFAPTSSVEIELLRFLQLRFGHVSCERVCSGSGIPNLYDFLKQSGAATASPEVAVRLAAAEDRTPLIVQAGLGSKPACEVCAAAMALFVSILGAEAGNLALKVFATGGLYLGGGIPPRILPALTDGRFLKAFQNKGRFSEHLARVPIHVINSRVTLIGAASHGLRLASINVGHKKKVPAWRPAGVQAQGRCGNN